MCVLFGRRIKWPAYQLARTDAIQGRRQKFVLGRYKVFGRYKTLMLIVELVQ